MTQAQLLIFLAKSLGNYSLTQSRVMQISLNSDSLHTLNYIQIQNFNLKFIESLF
ncbi:hypothetical protein NIES25_31980 [Nostoc linckia NIES-25]|nr:hypothetical protein NIES25_31980 [Nostoc linckia NIES-25]